MATTAPIAEPTLTDRLAAHALEFPDEDNASEDWQTNRLRVTPERAAALASMLNWLSRHQPELADQLTSDLTPADLAQRPRYSFAPIRTAWERSTQGQGRTQPGIPTRPAGNGVRINSISWLDQPDPHNRLQHLLETIQQWPQRQTASNETKRYLAEVVAYRLTAPALQQVTTMNKYDHYGRQITEPLADYVINKYDSPGPTYDNWQDEVLWSLVHDCKEACWESIARSADAAEKLLRSRTARQASRAAAALEQEMDYLITVEARIHQIACLEEDRDGWIAEENPSDSFFKYGTSLGYTTVKAIQEFLDIWQPVYDNPTEEWDENTEPTTPMALAMRDPVKLRLITRCVRSFHPFEAKQITREVLANVPFYGPCSIEEIHALEEALSQPVSDQETFEVEAILARKEPNRYQQLSPAEGGPPTSTVNYVRKKENNNGAT